MIRKYIILVSLFGFMLAPPLFAQIVNQNSLKIESGTVVYLGANFTNTASGQLDTEGDIHVKGDFTNEGTVTATAGTVYFDSSTEATQNLNGSAATAQFYNLSVNNTATGVQGLAVADGFNLEVTNGVAITAGKLRLMGESQLVQTHAGTNANTGTGHLLKDQEGAKNAYRYNFWSSPVRNVTDHYTVEQVIKDGTTPDLFDPINIGLTTSYNGNDTGSPIQVSTYWFFKFINGAIDAYNEEGWEHLFDPGTTTPSAVANLAPAEGYIMKGVNATATYEEKQNYSFEGLPNDGDYVINLAADKSYLVGNPYPCALDADAFINYNAVNHTYMDGTLYFWEHWSTNTHVYTEYGGGYAEYNLSGGTVAPLYGHFTGGSGTGSITPERYIPVGQGFMINSKTTAGGPVTFKNNQRAFRIEGNNSNFFKSGHSENSAVTARFWLNYTAPNNGTRQLLLAFTNGAATDAFDRGYDGKFQELNSNDLYFTMEDEGRNFAYGIQGVGSFDIDKEYPLVLKCATEGFHTISLGAVENMDVPIYILDERTQSTHNLTQSDFILKLEPGTYTDRFKIVFKSASGLVSDEDIFLNNSIKVYYADDNIIILNPNHINIKQLNVFNTLGQLVLKNDFTEDTSDAKVIIPFHFAQAPYYLLGNSEYGSFSTKILNY